MEADAGEALVNRSQILKDANAQVIGVIGDDDTNTIKKIRDNSNRTIYKLSDRNHVTNNFSKELYKLESAHRELKKQGVINHIKKCFTYALSQNKKQSQQLALALLSIPNHLFNEHKDCGTWCSTKNPRPG